MVTNLLSISYNNIKETNNSLLRKLKWNSILFHKHYATPVLQVNVKGQKVKGITVYF